MKYFARLARNSTSAAQAVGFRFRAGSVAIVAFVCLIIPTLARAESISIQELNEKIEQLSAARKPPLEVRYQVQGRAAPASRRLLRFKNSKVRFESEVDLLEPARRNANLEVTGTVVRDEQKNTYVFRVESVRELASDLDMFFERRRELRREPAEKWYALGDWAAKRGTFYNDDELLARSEEAYLHGLDLERRELSEEDAAGFLTLAAKAQAMRVPERIAQELIHEGLTIRWRKTRTAQGAALQDLLQQIKERLPGSTEPLSDPHAHLQKDYFDSPSATYRNADSQTRPKLHRLLYGDVLLRTLLPELEADGSNGFAVAEKIERLVPEQRMVAERLRDQALEARAKEVERLSKSDVLALAQDYRGRQQPQQAEHVIESWLRLRQRRLDPDDTEGLIQVAGDYRKLLKRNDLADHLLKEAWTRNPKASDVAERLADAGYQLQDGNWVVAANMTARPEGKLEQSIRAGRIEQGMTASHVRRSLGEPQNTARAATYGQITEVWSYDQSGGARLTVRLKRNRRQTELTVVDVTQTSAQ